MRQMIFLQVSHVRRQLVMVQPVMRAIVADVAKNAAREDGDGGIPVVPEHCVCKLVERGGEHEEQSWRHDKSVFVHRQIMVDAVEDKMKGQENWMIRQNFVDVEQEAVQEIFDQCPQKETQAPVSYTLDRVRQVADTQI